MKSTIYFGLIIGLFTGIFNKSKCEAAESAVDLAVTNGEAAVYILYDDGVVQTAGEAVNHGSLGNINAVSLTLTPSGNGYYIMDEDGEIYSFGDAIVFGKSVNTRVKSVDMELAPLGGFYILREDGTVVTIGQAVYFGQFNQDHAVDFELTHDGLGYYLLFQDGTISFFGSAINHGYSVSSRMNAVNLEIQQNGYYVLYDDGTVLNFGNAIPLPSSSSSTELRVDMELTQRGYQVLDESGETDSFFRLDNQGSISWFAKARPRAVQQQPTPTPTRTPLPNTPYFVLNLDGFTQQIIGQLDSSLQILSSMTSSQVTLPSGDTFIVVADQGSELSRKIQYYSHENFTNPEQSGELFAEVIPSRGAASIQGISYGSPGLIVSIVDSGRTRLILIVGEFDESSVSGFQFID